MNLLAIDPGNATGWAVFVDNALESCGTIKPVLWETLSVPPGGFVIIEEPTIYPHSKADPANIMALQLKVGDLRGFFSRRGYTVELVQPRTWKGQVPKDIHAGRTLRKLSAAERVRIPTKHTHDTLDAVGLGLWRIGR
jgi:hypothetical protein